MPQKSTLLLKGCWKGLRPCTGKWSCFNIRAFRPIWGAIDFVSNFYLLDITVRVSLLENHGCNFSKKPKRFGSHWIFFQKGLFSAISCFMVAVFYFFALLQATCSVIPKDKLILSSGTWTCFCRRAIYRRSILQYVSPVTSRWRRFRTDGSRCSTIHWFPGAWFINPITFCFSRISDFLLNIYAYNVHSNF